MSVGLERRWDRSLVGRNPSQILITGSNVACSFIDDQGGGGMPGPHELVCFDLEGTQRWAARDFDLQLALDDGRLIGRTNAKQLRALDSDGRDTLGARKDGRDVRFDDVRDVRRIADRVIIRTKTETVATDGSLNILARIPVSSDRSGVVVDDAVLYLDGDQIMRADQQGRVELMCGIPVAMANEAMLRWERETGTPALHGVALVRIDPSADLGSELVAAATDPSRQKPFAIGQRLPNFQWTLSYLESTKSLFLTNRASPHVIVCLGLDGVARWARYLSAGCCGGDPVALPNGELVASSGCGAVISWLDSAGDVKRQSAPHQGEGLANAYSGRVRTLPDSSSIVYGGMGVVSFDATGQPSWRSDDHCSCFDYDHAFGLLVTAWWNDTMQKTVTIRCARTVDRGHARA